MATSSGLRKASTEERRMILKRETGADLAHTSSHSIDEGKCKRNIENFIGATQIPLGVAGPMKINGTYVRGERLIPLATTEGVLVASVSRGAHATEEKGITVRMTRNGITRAPAFRVRDIDHGLKAKEWIEKNFGRIAKEAKFDKYLDMTGVNVFLAGRTLFARFEYDAYDAMGMNGATVMSNNASEIIEKETGAKFITVSGNVCTDKKHSGVNFILGRGKSMLADAFVSRETVENILKTTPEAIVEVNYRKNYVGSAVAMSSQNMHYANILAAAFIASGQDPAQVVECSQGITTAEADEGGLYFSIYMPILEVASFGGGTMLETQREAINVMQAKTSNEVAEIITAAVLCGELSGMAAQAALHLAKAHDDKRKL